MLDKRAILFLTALALSPGTAWADTIFSDDFNRLTGEAVGNGWSETEHGPNDVAITHLTGLSGDNQLRMRDNLVGDGVDAGVALSGVSAVNFSNITLSFSYVGLNTQSTDFLHADWKLSSATLWTSLATFALGNTSLPFASSGFLALDALAANGLIDIRLWTDVSEGDPGNNEGVYIDNLLLSGTSNNLALLRVPVTPVPLPATLPLFAGGLGVIGWLARRRRGQSARA